jgi:prepilin-type processing-associated H-X9-DG protein
LPYLDEGVLYRKFDFAKGVHDPVNSKLGEHHVSVLRCSSAPNQLPTYAGCHHDVEAPIDVDNHGVLFLNSRVPLTEITDGLAYTLFVGEHAAPGTVWADGSNMSLRNTGNPMMPARPAAGASISAYQPVGADAEPTPGTPEEEAAKQAAAMRVGGFSSWHAGGVNFVLGDGSVKFLSSNISADLFRRLGNRADNELVGAF